MKYGFKRTALIVALGLVALACHNNVATPTPAALEPTCNRFRLANGQYICLHSRPLGAIVARVDHQHAGAAVEPLTDPNFSGPLEQSVDLRARSLDGCLQVRNQGECGWCVAHAVGAALDGLYCAEGCSPSRVSMPALWEQGHNGMIADNDCVPGWQTEDALAAASNGTPLPSESTWAYSGTPRSMLAARPSDMALMMDPRFGATGHGSIAITNDAAQLEQMKRVLSSGRVLVVWSGVCFNNGWQTGTATIQAPMGNCAANGTDQYDGYHAYSIVGYDDMTMEFIALNSWGEGWGQGGYMRLSYGFVQQEMQGVGYLSQIDRTHGACTTDPMATTIADRCTALTDCDSCAATSGCLFCDGNCVAADATRAAPATGTCTTTVTTPTQCPAPTGDCTMNADCGSCASAAGCAWCDGRGCVAWPSDHLACEDSTRIATDAAQCNDTTHACEMATDCATCSALTGCGWCEAASGSIHAGAAGNCFGGNMTAPDRVACDPTAWSPATGMCPMLLDGGTMADGGIPGGGCASLGCGACVTTPDCTFCPGTQQCIAASDAASCSGGTSNSVDTCDTCHPFGYTCTDRFACCDATTNPNIQCIRGFCEDTSMCGMLGTPCELGGAHCCGGASCGLSPSSQFQCCLVPNGLCTNDADCCGFERCANGRCRAQAVGESCMNSQECTGGSYCLSNMTCGF